MFSLRNFLMTGFKNAVGKMEDYQIILNATGWFEKNVLLEEDLAELQELIDEKNTPVEETKFETGEETGINEEATDTNVTTIEEVEEENTEENEVEE